MNVVVDLLTMAAALAIVYCVFSTIQGYVKGPGTEQQQQQQHGQGYGQMKKHDQVCSRASRPATGYVVRVGKDWVDVEWHAGIKCCYRTRARRMDVVPIAEHLKQAVDNFKPNTKGDSQSPDLLAFYKKVAPFLRRLKEPRHDDCETNDYVCGSSECNDALKALDQLEAND